MKERHKIRNEKGKERNEKGKERKGKGKERKGEEKRVEKSSGYEGRMDGVRNFSLLME